MALESNVNLLAAHPYFRLRLRHAHRGTFTSQGPGLPTSDNWLFLVFAGGGAEDALRDPATGEVFPMRPGCFYFVPCNHRIDWTLTPAVQFVSLHFDLELFYGLDVFREHHHCHQAENPGVVEAAWRLVGRKDGGADVLCEMNGIIFTLCSGYLDGGAAGAQERLAKGQRYAKALEFIRDKGDANTTVENLADLCGMRADVFSRKFSRDMGMPPKEFLANTLLRKATEMLMAPGVSVLEVAERLRFSSGHYLSYFIKRRTGMHPTQYRETNGWK